MVSVNVAPTYGNTRKIPNEDSSDFEFDETNLFEPSRFPGLDRIDTGTKVAYGVRFSSLGPRATEVSGSLRPELLASPTTSSSPPIPACSTISPTMSARSTCAPAACSISAIASAWARSDLQFRRSDALASFGPAFLRFNLGYLNLSKEPEAFDGDSGSFSNSGGFDSREEVTLGARAAADRADRHRRADAARPQRQPDRGQPARPDLYAPLSHAGASASSSA